MESQCDSKNRDRKSAVTARERSKKAPVFIERELLSSNFTSKQRCTLLQAVSRKKFKNL